MKSWSSCLYHKIGTIPWQFVHLQYSAADLSDKKKIEFLNFTSFFSSFSFIVLLICIHFHNLILYFSFHKNAFFILLLLYIDTYTYIRKTVAKISAIKMKPFFFPTISQIFHARLPNSNPSNCEKRMAFFGKLFFVLRHVLHSSMVQKARDANTYI